MNVETSRSVLAAWDQAQGQRPGRQAVLLLTHLAGQTTESAGELRIGERDALLLRVREQIFGADAEGTAVCPACGDMAEFRFRPASLVAEVAEELGAAEVEWVFGAYRVAFRPPTAADAAAVCSAPTVDAAREMLLRRSVLYVRQGEASSEWPLPREVEEFAAARMEACDPRATTKLAFVCPACKHPWTEIFDAVSFLWAEIADAASRIFREIHDLALRYGWSEAEILTMHPARRRMYLKLAEA